MNTQEEQLTKLEEDIKGVLADFVFEKNDADTRHSIKAFVENYINTNAPHVDYYIHCSDVNNTEDIIKLNELVVDVCIRNDPSEDFFNTTYQLQSDL